MGGGFTSILTSETKQVRKYTGGSHLLFCEVLHICKIICFASFQNTLNPDWDDFLFNEAGWNGNDKEHLKLVFAICLTDLI